MSLPWLKSETEALDRALTAQRLGHAPLLHGPAGIGKSDLAHWLVARILCLAGNVSAPCGECRSCRLLAAGTHPDLFVATVPEDKTQITVDIIRQLSAGLQLTPSIGRHRVGLIEPAERMNSNAANALLKTLEEPSARAWLILVCDQPAALPATVRSRCQKISLRPPSRSEALTWLRAQEPGSEEGQLALALEACGEAPLKAQALLRGEGLQFGLEIRDALLKLASGTAIDANATDAWASRPAESWFWIAHWTRHWLADMLGVPAGSGNNPAPPGRPTAELARAWQEALEARKLADSSVRADLLLGKWLLEWQSIFAVGN